MGRGADQEAGAPWLATVSNNPRKPLENHTRSSQAVLGILAELALTNTSGYGKASHNFGIYYWKRDLMANDVWDLLVTRMRGVILQYWTLTKKKKKRTFQT